MYKASTPEQNAAGQAKSDESTKEQKDEPIEGEYKDKKN